MGCLPLQISVLLLATLFTVVLSEEDVFLQIQPNSPVIRKEVGASLALTCKPIARRPQLVTQLEWLDPKNRRIDSTNRASPVYVQALPGEVGSVLILSKLTENLAGNYSCSAHYANSEPLRTSILVNTYIDITFAVAPENQYPIVGTDYKVKCIVHGNPSPLIEWNKNDETISTHDRYITEFDGLLIKNVRESDDGVYKCTAVVLSTGQIKTRNIKVEVQVPPKIEKIDEISIIEGESASAKCTATGKPPPTYSWIKENTADDLKLTDRFKVKENTGELYISRVEMYDDSFYKCTARNKAGITETRVKINVLVKPKIYELLNVTAPVGSDTKIICKVHGRPPPIVTFKKLSHKISFEPGPQKWDNRIVVEQQSNAEKGETFATLSISHLNRTDDGLYECIPENKAGRDYRKGHITVEFPPTFERTKDLPPAYAWPGHPGNLTCIPEAIPNATITWKFQGIEINRQSQNFEIHGASPVSYLIVKPINDRRFFAPYECYATNKHGFSSLFIDLREGTIPEKIPQAKRERITATTIKFSIVAPYQSMGLPIKSITVQYRPERELTWEYARNHTWSFNAPYILENLIPEVTYHFRFSARNDVGRGAWTNTETISMPRRSEPAEPKLLYSPHSLLTDSNESNREGLIVASPYADHYELRWNVPSDNGEPIIRYDIRYCSTEKQNEVWQDTDCTEQIQQSVEYTNYEMNGLKPDTIYKIEVRAHNAIGASSPAQILVKTARGMDPYVPMESGPITSGAIIGMVVAGILLVILVVDILCFCVNRTGILALLCYHAKSKKHDEEDPKLGRGERQPLNSDENHHSNGEKPMSVEYDGRKVHSKSGEIIGKHSAV